MKLKKPKIALNLFSLATRINSKHAIAWNNKGWALNTLDRFEEGLSALDKAIENDEKLSMAWNNRGWAYNSLGDIAKGKENLLKAFELGAENSFAVNNLAFSQIQLKDYSSAEQTLLKGIKQHPNEDQINCSLAGAYLSQNRFEEAIIRGEISLKTDPKCIASHLTIAWSYAKMENYEFAKKILEKAISVTTNPTHKGHLHLNLSSILLLDKKYDNAKNNLVNANGLLPQKHLKTLGEAQILHQSGNNEEAKKLYKDFLDKFPNNKVAWNNYSCVLFE